MWKAVSLGHTLLHLPLPENPCQGLRWCRRDIRVIPSPPLRAGFGPQNMISSIIVILLFHTFSIFTMYKINRILPKVEHLESPHFYNSNDSTYIQIHSLEAKLWRSGSCWVFVYLFSIPDQKRLFSVNSSNYGKYRISPDRSLRDEYDYGKNVGIEQLVTEKSWNYSLLRKGLEFPIG